MKKFLLFCASLFLTGATLFGQTTLLTEGWESTTDGTNVAPTGWTVDLVSGTNITYYKSVGTYPAVNPIEGTRVVDFESYSFGSGYQNRLRRSTPLSTVGYGTVTVDFEWYTDPGYATYLAEGVTVQWSTDGVTWSPAPQDPSTYFMRYNAKAQWVLENVTLPAGAGNQATLYVGFFFNCLDGNDCHMDIMHVKGLAPCVTPSAQATALILTPATTTINGSFTPSATANSYLVVRSLSSTLSATPVNGTTYIAGAAFGGGIIDYWGAGPTFTSTGLTPNTHYYYYIFAANNNCGGTPPLYLTTAPLTGNTNTLALIPISGNKFIGPTGDFFTLTAAFAYLNGNGVNGPLNLILQSTYVSTVEPAFPIPAQLL